jgi:hypothetical protein
MSRHVKWRLAVAEDQPALDDMHQRMQKKLGKRMDRPDLFTEPVLITVVGEVNGVIVQGFFLEAVGEACAMAPHVLAVKELQEGVDMLEACARSYQLRLIRSFVPAFMVPQKSDRREWEEKPYRPSALERMLTKIGFTREKPGYQQFFRWLVRRPQ